MYIYIYVCVYIYIYIHTHTHLFYTYFYHSLIWSLEQVLLCIWQVQLKCIPANAQLRWNQEQHGNRKRKSARSILVLLLTRWFLPGVTGLNNPTTPRISAITSDAVETARHSSSMDRCIVKDMLEWYEAYYSICLYLCIYMIIIGYIQNILFHFMHVYVYTICVRTIHSYSWVRRPGRSAPVSD